MEQDATITGTNRAAEAPHEAAPAHNLSLVSIDNIQENNIQENNKQADKQENRNHRPARSTKLGVILASEFGNLHLRLRLLNTALIFCPRLCFVRTRTALYRLCGIRVGARTAIIGNLSLSGGGPIFSRLRIGCDCVLNAPLHLDLSAAITIGDGVCIGHHVVLITTEHEIGPAHYRCGLTTVKPITIGNGCWIGARATILPGVTLGDGCIVSAGAVVSNDVPPNKVVAGNPARPVKSVD